MKSTFSWKEVLTFALILIAIILMWSGAWYLIDKYIVVGQTDQAALNAAALKGQFGDMFGAINALFSGFAFAGIIVTLLLQKRDLVETRNAMSNERFDNTFFQLLNVHIDITQNISARGGSGREAFTAFNEYLKQSDQDFHVFCALEKLSRPQVRTIIDSRNVNVQIYPELEEADVTNINESLKVGIGAFNNYLDETVAMHEQKIKDAYTNASKQYIDHFSHYFRNLYHILKFIDESRLIEKNNKNNYAKFVRAQLSDIELVVIFYNSICKIELPGRAEMELGYPKMGKLLVKFDVLQNMNPLSLIHPIHKQIFDKNNKDVK